jgi:hypothetical protein
VSLLSLSLFFFFSFLPKNINKIIEFLKYKVYQKARRNRPKEQGNFLYSYTYKINRFGVRRICCCLDMFWVKAYKIVKGKKLEKMQLEDQMHTKREQKLNISDLESTFNSSENNCYIYFRRKTKNPIISKIKTDYKLYCVSLLFYFHYLKQLFRLFSVKNLYIVLAILLLRSLIKS